jgi:hypothetical protein
MDDEVVRFRRAAARESRTGTKCDDAIPQSFSRDEPGFPTIEPDGTSTSNPALFPGTVIADTFDNFYVGSLDWSMGPKLFTNLTVGLYDYGTHGSGAGEELRHTFGQSNLQSGSFNFPRSRTHCAP